MLVGAPSALGPRPPAPARATWRYVERGRTHELRAEYSTREGALLVTELAGAERLEERLAVPQPWEARVALWLLEARLAQLGEYWRARPGAPGWTRVMRPIGAPVPDARENEVIRPEGAPLFHHYHDERGGDRLLAALRDAAAPRYTVVRAMLDVEDLHIGRIDIVRSGLPDALSRSVVLREQIALTQSGLGKLVTRDEYERAFGQGGEKRAARLVEEVVSRVRDGELDRPYPPVEATDVYAEFLVRIHDPRLLALHRRFLYAGEEDDLLEGGPVVIRKTIQHKRTQVDHREQHLLTILEASLLAREKMQSGKLARGDPEVRALTRLAYYL